MKLIDYLVASAGWQVLIRASKPLVGYLNRFSGNKPLEIFPNVLSTDPRFLKLTEDLVSELKGPEWQPKVNKFGLSENGLSGGAERLLTVAGIRATPVATGMEDNSSLRASLGLPTEFRTPRERAIFRELVKEFFGHGASAPARIKKDATTGFPHFTKSMLVKKKLYISTLSFLRDNARKWLTPLDFIKAMIYPVLLIVYRLQADLPSKKRTVDVGGESRVDVDNSTSFAGHIAMRVRVAYAASGTVNYAMTCLCACIRAGYYARFGKTYKNRGAADGSTKLQRFAKVFGIDVTNFDTTVGELLFEALLEDLEFHQLFTPAVISLWRACLGAPSISQSPYPADRPKKWRTTGDPGSNAGFSLKRGLPSGVAMNPEIGKFMMSFEVLVRYDHLTGNVLGNVARYLAHEMPDMAFLNSADDNLIGVMDPRHADKFVAAPGYFKLDLEEYPVYLGTIYCGEPGSVYGLPNLMSFLERWLVPEHSIGFDEDDRRSQWYTGWVQRKAMYSEHPRFLDVYHMLDRLVTKHFGKSVEALMLEREQPRMKLSVVANSAADMLYMNNPDVIHYRIAPEDVTPAILDMEVATIPADENTRWAQHLTDPGFSWMGEAA